MAPPVRVFLSYRREDASGHAGRLYDLLAARYGAERVFMDIDAIPLGSEFRGTIERAVASCDVLIALIGRSWTGATDAEGRRRLDDPDDFVRRELESALEQDVVVVPTCVQGASVPRADELPPSLAPLAGRQGFELRDIGWQDDVGRLVRRLEQIARERAAEQGDAKRAAKPPAAAPRRRIPWKAVAAAVALLALAGVAIGLAASGDDSDTGSRGDSPAASPDAERQLLALIPKGIRPDCDPTSSPDPRAEVSLSCGVASAMTADYLLFADRGTADAWYTQKRIENGVDPDDGDCTKERFRGETAYSVDGRAAGRYFCLIDDEGKPEVWALDRRGTVGMGVTVYRGSGQPAVEQFLELWDCCIPVRR